MISLVSFCKEINAQESSHETFIGVLISGGNQKMGTIDIYKGLHPYTYSILSFAVTYQQAIWADRAKGHNHWRFYYLIQPQVGFSAYQYRNGDTEYKHGVEVGVDAGFVLRKRFLHEKIGYYFGGTTGPLYASELPERQHAGFLFCDTGFMGINIQISNKIQLDTRFGFRHLSNAGIDFPNNGINNFISNAGVIVQL
ncbi:MAG: hypothetical protein RLY11_81 [Bacteroidota bacterium]